MRRWHHDGTGRNNFVRQLRAVRVRADERSTNRNPYAFNESAAAASEGNAPVTNTAAAPQLSELFIRTVTGAQSPRVAAEIQSSLESRRRRRRQS